MKRLIFTGPVIKLLTAFLTIVVIGLFVYFNSQMPRPRERNRISATRGEFSIIQPPDWEGESVYLPAEDVFSVSIVTTPKKVIGLGPELRVGEFRQSPDLDKLRSTGMHDQPFLGKTALALGRSVRRQFFWRMVFEQDGRWFEIVLRLDAAQDVPKTRWWDYLSSFQTGAPTTQTARSEPDSVLMSQ